MYTAHSTSLRPRLQSTHSKPPRTRHTRVQSTSSGNELSFSDVLTRQQQLDNFKLLCQQPDEHIDLLHASTLIACHRYPKADFQEVKEIIDDLAVGVEALLPHSSSPRYPLKTISAISSYLYKDRGFRGNTNDYYNPDNSCINMVVKTRVGIPLTLCVVYSEISKRLGLPLTGVNIPGHLFLTPKDPDHGDFLIDAFEGGKICFLEDAEETLEKIYKKPVKIDPAFLSKRKRDLPTTTLLTRMLNNLKQVYSLQDDYVNLLIITEYLRAVRPGDADEVRNQGVLLYKMKRWQEASDVLKEYLSRAPDNPDADKIRKLLESIE